ncbi:MAG: helix-turn-helix transcriptional regulator [Gemmatimonadota bacterium]|nr:helix-turn-helix transcriptional regulator [Gemmatimonadota bacterium]
MGRSNASPGGRPPRPWGQSLIRAFGQNVRRHRQYRRLKQTDLAYLAHLHPDSVSEVERCTGNPTLHTVHALALALECDPTALLNRQLYRSETIAKQVLAATGDTIGWCVARHPDFSRLTHVRQQMLEQGVAGLLVVGHWFDGQVLGGRPTRTAVLNAVTRWDAAGLVRPGTFASELEHFRNRYVGVGGAATTAAFDVLGIRNPGDRKIVRAVLLDGEEAAKKRALAALVIVGHLRLGVFGPNWLTTALEDQIEDLQRANTALQRTVEIDEKARRLKGDGA